MKFTFRENELNKYLSYFTTETRHGLHLGSTNHFADNVRIDEQPVVPTGTGTTVTGGLDLTSIITNGFAVGSARSASRPITGQIDDLMVLPYALGATEALALYASGTAPTIGYPRLIATGDFSHDASVTVRGANVRQTNIHLNGVNNYKSVEFAMEEV